MNKILFVLMAIFIASCDSQNTPKDTLVVGRGIDDLITLDPAESYEFSSAEYTYNTYDTLVVRDDKNPENILPHVAESWSVSKDGKEITFKIREGIKFHSGNDLTAHDVVYSLRRAVSLMKEPSEIISQFGINPKNVNDKIIAIDNTTLRFKMDKSYAPTLVLNCLTAPVGAVVDSKLLKEHEQNGDYGNKWLKTNEAGSGPFKLKSWKASESLTLEANSNHWKTPPKLKQVMIRHISDPSTGRVMLEKKDLDIMGDLKYEQAEQIKDVEKSRVPVLATKFLSVNQQNKYLSNPLVLEAIRYAIDYDTIANTILRGDVFVHQSFIPQGLPYALTDKVYSYDVEKAKKLMKQAGYENGFEVNLETTHKDFGQILQSNLGKIGIKVNINLGDGKQVLTRIRERNYDMGFSTWSPDFSDPHANAMSFSKNLDNSSQSKNKTIAWRVSWNIPELTNLTDKAMSERDPEKREKMYHTLQKELYKSPIINLFQSMKTYVFQKNVKGMVFPSGLSSAYYYNAYKD